MSDLVKIEVTTTAVHAEMVLKAAAAELKNHVVYLRQEQMDEIAANKFGEARCTGARIDKALLGAFDAQHLLETFTSQGEEKA